MGTFGSIWTPPTREPGLHEARASRSSTRRALTTRWFRPAIPNACFTRQASPSRRLGPEHRASDLQVGHEGRTGQRGAERAREGTRVHAAQDVDGRMRLGLRARSPQDREGARGGTERAPRQPRGDSGAESSSTRTSPARAETRRGARCEASSRAARLAWARSERPRASSRSASRFRTQAKRAAMRRAVEEGPESPARVRASRSRGRPRMSIGESGGGSAPAPGVEVEVSGEVLRTIAPRSARARSPRDRRSPATRAPSSSPASRKRAANEAVCSRFALSKPRPIVATNDAGVAHAGTRSQNQSRTAKRADVVTERVRSARA